MLVSSNTAVHEAGHVVIGLALGIEIISADMTPTKSPRGHQTAGGVTFRFSLRAEEQVRDAIQRKLTFAFAGIWAEHHILGKAAVSLEGVGTQLDDLDTAEAAMKCATGHGIPHHETGLLWRAAWDAAAKLTNRFADEITRVATALEEHQSLSQDQISDLLESSNLEIPSGEAP